MNPTLFDTAPAWILDQLHTAGLPLRRGQSTVTTHRRQRATPRWHHCGQPVWTGPCDRNDVTLDPTPTTTDGELFAILTGRRTYEMDFHTEIIRRWPEHISIDSADVVRVYVAHICGGPYPIVNNRWEPAPLAVLDTPPY